MQTGEEQAWLARFMAMETRRELAGVAAGEGDAHSLAVAARMLLMAWNKELSDLFAPEDRDAIVRELVRAWPVVKAQPPAGLAVEQLRLGFVAMALLADDRIADGREATNAFGGGFDAALDIVKRLALALESHAQTALLARRYGVRWLTT